MINGPGRCHISTSHTLLINTIINEGFCCLQCSPVGGYTPLLTSFLSIFGLPDFTLSLFITFFYPLQDSCLLPPSSSISSIFLFISVTALSSFLCPVFYFCLCFLLHLSNFLPRFSLSISISVSRLSAARFKCIYFITAVTLHFFSFILHSSVS